MHGWVNELFFYDRGHRLLPGSFCGFIQTFIVCSLDYWLRKWVTDTNCDIAQAESQHNPHVRVVGVFYFAQPPQLNWSSPILALSLSENGEGLRQTVLRQWWRRASVLDQRQEGRLWSIGRHSHQHSIVQPRWNMPKQCFSEEAR